MKAGFLSALICVHLRLKSIVSQRVDTSADLFWRSAVRPQLTTKSRGIKTTGPRCLLSSISSDAFVVTKGTVPPLSQPRSTEGFKLLSFAEVFHPGIAHDGDNGRVRSQLFG
jgi:hypothetical protein